MSNRELMSAIIILLIGSLLGCSRHRVSSSEDLQPRYTVGMPWQSRGYWFYPTEQFSYEATGLAVVDAQEQSSGRQTADGERYDPRLATGAHQTLQLPTILRVRNLENGRELRLRVNDRGPASPGRLLSVTPEAARLLGLLPDQATPVRVIEDEDLTQALLEHVAGAPLPQGTAAPVGALQEQSLMPPEARYSPHESNSSTPNPPRRTGSILFGETVSPNALSPGQLWIDAGEFSTSRYARTVAASVGGVVQQQGYGRSVIFKVRLGPFDTVSQADAALDRALSGRVTGARIIIE